MSRKKTTLHKKKLMSRIKGLQGSWVILVDEQESYVEAQDIEFGCLLD